MIALIAGVVVVVVIAVVVFIVSRNGDSTAPVLSSATPGAPVSVGAPARVNLKTSMPAGKSLPGNWNTFLATEAPADMKQGVPDADLSVVKCGYPVSRDGTWATSVSCGPMVISGKTFFFTTNVTIQADGNIFIRSDAYWGRGVGGAVPVIDASGTVLFSIH